MDWLKDWLVIVKKQNQSAIALAAVTAIAGIGLSVYSLSGSKYDVIEFCFKPPVKAKTKKKFCTQDKQYIVPQGYWREEDYVPANPRFQPEGTFVLSEKATRLRTIPATNPNARRRAVASLCLLSFSTFVASKRLQRYKREFVKYFEALKTDLTTEVLEQEQEREILTHKTAVETSYIKDKISEVDANKRQSLKSQEQIDFEVEQARKHNEVVEMQRQLQITKLKAEIAKLEAEIAKYKATANKAPTTVEIATEIDWKALCPGKVGEIDFYDWHNLIDDAVGIIVAGNSGSGKTSTAVWVAGVLTNDEPAQILALDPHANINVLWEELGIYTISDFALIEKQLVLLIDLLDERRGLNKEQLDLEPTIIIFGDEINACLDSFGNPEVIELALKRLGSEGRKYKMVFIALNQSSNAKDLGVSGQMKNNYLIIALNATARQIAKGIWKKDDPRRMEIEYAAYSCLVSGCIPEQVAIHPTHHTYKTYKKVGNKPKGLLPINQNPLTIPLSKDQPHEHDWYEEIEAWAKKLGRVPTPDEIQTKWQELMGHPATSKQIELIHEHLLNLDQN